MLIESEERIAPTAQRRVAPAWLLPALPDGAALLALALCALLLAQLFSLAPRRAAFDMQASMDSLPREGFHSLERFPHGTGTYAWTTGSSLLELPNPGGSAVLQMLAGGIERRATVQLHLDDSALAFEVDRPLRSYHVLLPRQGSTRLLLRLDTPVMSTPQRDVGILISRLSISGGGSVPVLLLALLVASVGVYGFLRRFGWNTPLAATLALALQGAGWLWLAQQGWRSVLAADTLLMIGAAALLIVGLEQGWQRLLAPANVRREQVPRLALPDQQALIWTALLLIILAGVLIHISLWGGTPHEQNDNYADIASIWRDGQRLLAGENPYARVLSGNMQTNDKYPTYFPGFYLLSALVQAAGLRSFAAWLSFWRPIFLCFNIGVAFLLFRVLQQRGLWLLALFAACFMLLGRWSLRITELQQLDFLPVFLLLLSLLLLRKQLWAALLLFSLSLALKQLAIFLAPLYLIFIWQTHSAGRPRWHRVLMSAALIASVPLLVSLPFIIWHSEGFVKSIVFSATRFPDDEMIPSVDVVISAAAPAFVGIAAKIPLLLMLLAIYASFLRRQSRLYLSAVLIMLVFVNFNTIFFPQYLFWVMPLIPLVICDGEQEP